MNISRQRFEIFSVRRAARNAGVAFAPLLLFAIILPHLRAQTVATGSVAGIVTDDKGKAVAGAKIDIINAATSASIHQITSSSGWYSSGPIQPGPYSLRVEAKDFNSANLTFDVRVGNTKTVDVRLQPGPGAPTTAAAAGVPVDVVEPSVQNVLDESQMRSLPINGRNIFDFAQINDNVQIQDAGVLDPGKNGINSVSLLSHYGRQTRISVDGADISDEIVGAPTQNLPAGAIDEFQISQSMLDLSSGTTSSGVINFISRSGGNHIHGALFGLFRGDEGAASVAGSAPQYFQRQQYGGHAGGPVIQDKVFWFADAERTKQDLLEPEPFAFPFNQLGANLNEPYRDFATDERIDWNMRGSTRAFYRVNFFNNTDVRPFGSASSTQNLSSDNNTLTNTLGVDFTTGAYVHSFRGEYLKLRSSVADATGALSGFDNPIPGLGINLGASVGGNCVLSGGGSYCGGPSWLGPQREIQSDKLIRYDGSRVWRDHIFRYGITFNRIDGARLTDLAAAPQVGTTSVLPLAFANPTLYPAEFVTLGNSIPFSTSQSALGLPGGGLNPDNRLELYVQDSYRVRHVTLTYGVHYLHDSGVSDSGLGGLPILNQWGSGYGDRIRNPNLNLAPQFGFAWNVGGGNKTVIRGGAGIFFWDPLLNNTLYDTPARSAQGNFLSTPQVCSEGVASPFPWPTTVAAGSAIAGGAATVVSTSTGPQALPTFCGGTIAAEAPAILALSHAYQAASAAATGANRNYIGSTLTALNNRGYDLFFPGYRTPRSYQMNIGFEKAMRSNTRVSVDYIRNIGEHYLIGQDINHSGAARSFNEANALAARDAAQTAHGCPTGFNQASCMVAALGVAGAQAAYSAAGLDSNLATTGGGPCSYCAFPGTNALTLNSGAVGGVDMLFPNGRSLYSGFQAKMIQHTDKLMRGVKDANFQVSYTYSKFLSQSQDENGSVTLATDNDNLTRFTGPDALDRKEQISFGGTFSLPFYTKFSLFAHFLSPLAQSIDLPELTNGGEIFATDWLGAGLPANGSPEPLPGTQIGQYERGTHYDNLRKVLTTYNHTYAGSLTPAGECLVGNSITGNPFACPGLVSGPAVLTPTDMLALGWVLPAVNSVALGAPGIPWFKSVDLKFAWPLPVKGRVTIEPSASVYNVLNDWNAFLPGNLPNASLLPGVNGLLAPTSIGGVVPGSSLAPFRANYQSGTSAMGTPRMFEFGLRISF